MDPQRLNVVISPGGSGKSAMPKLQRLAEVAKSKGVGVEILNCEGEPDPDKRVVGLLNSRMKRCDRLVLAGSSMGGYVSTVAAENVAVDGLFLLCPVLYLEPYQNLDPHPKATSIALVHGWNDEVVEPESIFRFAKKFNATVHFVPGNHSLDDQLDSVGIFFGIFLDGILKKMSEKPCKKTMKIPLRTILKPDF